MANAATTGTAGTHLADYRAWLLASDRPPGTVRLRCYYVTRLARDISGHLDASTDDLVTWLASKDWSTETRRSARATLRSYYRWAHTAGYINADPAAALPQVRANPGIPRPAAETTIRDALERADDRERLMILLGAHAGLRRSEIAAVHTRDLVPDLVGWSLLVRGKGRRQRLVPLTRELARELRHAPPGWVFPSPAGGHLTPGHVGKLLSSVLGDGITAHQLRHRFATRAYAVDHDLLAVQQMLGHAKPETTQVYTELPAGRARSIIDQIAA